MNSKIRRLGPVVLLAGLGVVATGCGTLSTGVSGPSLTGGGVDVTPMEYTPMQVDLGLLGGSVTGPSLDPGAVTIDIPTINTGGLWYSVNF
ncbi:MAG: hypothetical protein HYR89_08380 [Actinobacteria bacterium]|nr:hypothetical protein [Actinomycetota bacterium]